MLTVEPKTLPKAKKAAKRKNTLTPLIAIGALVFVVLLVVIGLFWFDVFGTTKTPTRPVIQQLSSRPYTSSSISPALLMNDPKAFLSIAFTRHLGVTLLVICSVVVLVASLITVVVMVYVPKWFPPTVEPPKEGLELLKKDPDHFVSTYAKHIIGGMVVLIVFVVVVVFGGKAANRKVKQAGRCLGLGGEHAKLVKNISDTYHRIEGMVEADAKPWTAYESLGTYAGFYNSDHTMLPQWKKCPFHLEDEENFIPTYINFVRYYKTRPDFQGKIGPFAYFAADNGKELMGFLFCSIDPDQLKYTIGAFPSDNHATKFLNEIAGNLSKVLKYLEAEEEKARKKAEAEKKKKAKEGGEVEEGEGDDQ